MDANFWYVEVTGPESVTADFIVGPMSQLGAAQCAERIRDRYRHGPDLEVGCYSLNTEAQVYAHFWHLEEDA